MADRHKGMPSKAKIASHWEGGYRCPDDWDVEEQGFICFVCGKPGEVERAHILAVVDGGSNDPSNLHLLCSGCHKDSEYLNGRRYEAWFHNASKARWKDPFDWRMEQRLLIPLGATDPLGAMALLREMTRSDAVDLGVEKYWKIAHGANVTVTDDGCVDVGEPVEPV